MQNIYIYLYITLNIFNVASSDKNPKALYVNCTVSIQKPTQSLPSIGRNYKKSCAKQNDNIQTLTYINFII